MRISFIIFSILILSGCSISAIAPQGEEQLNENISRISAMDSQVERKRKAVFWSLKEVRNLSELEEFMNSVDLKVKDSIRVETVTKEGDPYVLDLSYDGEHLTVERNMNGDEKRYNKIIVSNRYNEHYEGDFIEYWAIDEQDEKKELILQIHPDLSYLHHP